MRVCARVRVRACVHACVRACVRAWGPVPQHANQRIGGSGFFTDRNFSVSIFSFNAHLVLFLDYGKMFVARGLI